MATKYMIVSIMAWVALAKGASTHTFDKAPDNRAVVVGDSFHLICAKRYPNVTVSWFNPSGQMVAKNGKVASGYVVMWTERNGKSQLYVNAKMSSAGEYTCKAEFNGQSHNATAQVVVLESAQPQCLQNSETLVEGEELVLVCEVRYAGIWAPALEWQSTSSLPPNRTDNETDSTTAKIRLTLLAEKGLSGIKFQCVGKFDQPKYITSIPHASESPNFQFQPCSTKAVTIYGVLGYRFDTAPANQAIVFGDSLRLTCSKRVPNVKISWSWSNAGGQMVESNDMAEKCNCVTWTNRKGQSRLFIMFVNMSSAGEYTCNVQDNGHWHSKSAQIIVLESAQLQCLQNTEILVEGEELVLVCEVRYAGIWAPALEWKSISSLPSYRIENETDSSTARVRLTLPAVRGMHEFPFHCEGKFDQPKYATPGSHASAIPTFQFQSCSAKAITIHWPPTEDIIVFVPEKEVYNEDEIVACRAETNPVATYIRWRGPGDEILSNSTTLKIGRPCRSSCYCEVGNYVGMVGQQELRFARRYLQKAALKPLTATGRKYTISAALKPLTATGRKYTISPALTPLTATGRKYREGKFNYKIFLYESIPRMVGCVLGGCYYWCVWYWDWRI